MISGAGKAGSTQAPLLALHVARELGLKPEIDNKLKIYEDLIGLKTIRSGLSLLESGFEPET